MVKSPEKHQPTSTLEALPQCSSSSCKYKGVRKRKWGKFVSEIRLPNCRERIWLGSYDTAEKAARAFDAALYCLRGRNAKFNFPDNPPEIENGTSMTPAEIQVASARFAHAAAGASSRIDDSDSQSDSLSSSEALHHAESPCPSVSDGAAPREMDFTDIPLDSDFLDQLLNMGAENNNTNNNNNISDFGLFPGFDDLGDFMAPALASADHYWPDGSEELCSQLWNF